LETKELGKPDNRGQEINKLQELRLKRRKGNLGNLFEREKKRKKMQKTLNSPFFRRKKDENGSDQLRGELARDMA